MSVEVGLVVSRSGSALWWHEPNNASAALLPDSNLLWDVIWQHRADVLGFAHSHPGTGPALPSSIDLSTFQAIEAGLGRPLFWWICTEDQFSQTLRFGSSYETTPYPEIVGWLPELRKRSYNKEKSQ